MVKATPQVTVSAPGKIIISGEHVVVHGYPALVAAVNRRIKVKIVSSRGSLGVFPLHSWTFVKDALETLVKHIGFSPKYLDVKIKSDIPIGSGMGSSAAFAVAISMAILKKTGKGYDLKKIGDLAYELEKKYHGNPSGVDIAISTYGGVLWYRKETEEFKVFTNVNVSKKLPEVFLLDTGKPDETTKGTVAHVSSLLRNKPVKTVKTFEKVEKVTRAFLQYLIGEKSDNFTNLIKTNERLLEELGVVSPSTRSLIKKIEDSGGAAKISGGGGIRGASGIMLVYHKDKQKLLDFAKKKNLKLERVTFGGKGVAIEK
jgi:mevalonate kinase